MGKRFWILTVLLALVPFAGCKKSEGTKIENFFGAPPELSEVSLTKERNDDVCMTDYGTIEWQCLYGGSCTYWDPSMTTASLDFVTASAKVVDATEPTPEYPSDILVVVIRFQDPPPGVPGEINLKSLEMFDNGPVVEGYVGPTQNYPVHSGDLVAEDGIFTRKFYFKTYTDTSPGFCIEDTDMAESLHTYSTYGSVISLEPSESIDFEFYVQAIDRNGNIATSTTFPVAIQGSFVESELAVQHFCGAVITYDPPSCLPP